MHHVSNTRDINASWQNSTDTDFGKTGKVMSFVQKLRMGLAA